MTSVSGEQQKRIAALLGKLPTSFSRIEGGYTPSSRWIVETAGERFFAKIAATTVTADMLRREARSYRVIRGSFIPALIGWEEHEFEPILITEDLSSALWPPPWNEHLVDLVLEGIEVLHKTAATVPPFAEVHGDWENGWQSVAADPEPFLSLGLASRQWLDHSLPMLLEAANSCPTEGEALCHWDIRSDNLCITRDGVKLIDWPEACLSNPDLDLGFWLPSLAFEGGPAPETILPNAPEVAAWVAGFFAARAGLPPISDAPRVRLVQQQQLHTALPWALRALGLPTHKSL